MVDESEDTSTYVVVVNHEEQYSIWPEGRGVPAGWKDVGTRGAKQDCLAYIGKVWTDMRPLSLRRAMEVKASSRGAKPQRAVAASRPRKVASKKAKRR